MATTSENRPGQQWVGLTTNEAPLNLNPGMLVEAKDVTIRRNSLIEQRAGLKQHTTEGVTTAGGQMVWPAYALNMKKYTDSATAGLTKKLEDRVVATLLTSSSLYLLADEVTSGSVTSLNATRHNYWGYPNLNSSTGTTTPIGMSMGDPRIVNGMYTTHMGPAKMLDTKSTVTEIQYDQLGEVVGSNYDLYSQPLGIPQVPFVTASYTPLNNVNVRATGMWQGTKIYSWAYRVVHKIGDNYGPPSPRSFVVTSVLPQVVSVSVGTVTSNKANVTLTFASAHGLTTSAGLMIEILDSDQPLWIGQWTTTTGGTSTTLVLSQVTCTDATAHTVIDWRTPLKATVNFWRPKEQAFVGYGATSSTNADYGYFGSRVFFQTGQFELYRTAVTESTQQVGPVDPGDEMLLVSSTASLLSNTSNANWSNIIGSGNAEGFQYLDYKRDSELADFLYTNPSQEGIAAANNMPPAARLLEDFKGTMFWGNVGTNNVLSFQLVDRLTTPLMVQINQALHPDETIDVLKNYSFNPTGTYSMSAQTFLAPSTGNLALDIQTQAQSLVQCINENPAIPLKARYVSGFNDEPGKVEVVAFDFSTAGLSLYAADLGTKITTTESIVTLPVDSTLRARIAPTAQNTLYPNATYPGLSFGRARNPNRLFWSKYQIPSSVPVTNYLDLPDGVTIIALRSTSLGLYVITDSGLWIIPDPSAPTLRVVDQSAHCWAQGSVQVLNDKLFVLTNQGIQVYGNGTIISLPVNNLILPARSLVTGVSSFADQKSEVEPWISSTVDPFNNEYLLFLPKADGSAFQVLRYNMNTQAWTLTDRNLRCGMFNSRNDNNKLMFGDGDRAVLLLERSSGETLEFSDEDVPINTTGTAASLATVQPSTGVKYFGALTTFSGINAVIKPNDFIVTSYTDNAGKVKYMTTNRVLEYAPATVNSLPSYEMVFEQPIDTPATNKTVVFIRSINSRIGLAPFTGGDAAMMKKWTMLHLNLLGSVRELTLFYHTDQRRQPEEFTITTTNPLDGWGQQPFGQFAWGNETDDAMPALDTIVPRHMAIDRSLNITLGNEGFNQDLKLQRMSVDFSGISKRFK